MTDAEWVIWSQLRNRRFAGLKFKRQWTIGPFVVDFCCIEHRLVVEIDGGQHSAEIDRSRTAALMRRGYRVVRFWNHDVLGNLDGVLEQLLGEVQTHPHPSPLPRAGEGA